MRVFSAALAGLVFGLGLLISGMSDPSKVLGFLDLAGAWNPSLAWVMVGAICVTSVGFAWARRREKTWLGDVFQWPKAVGVDGPLIVGSALFGLGWGLAGLCPGPALVLVGQGNVEAVVFGLAMGLGMFGYSCWTRISQR